MSFNCRQLHGFQIARGTNYIRCTLLLFFAFNFCHGIRLSYNMLHQLQSRRGYRANTDSWVLAYAAWSDLEHSSSKPLSVVDLGAGNGLASIIFGLRSQRLATMCLVEFQEQLALKACRNMELNGIPGADVRFHDLKFDLPSDLHGIADVVLCNPPFYGLSTRLPPKNMEKRLAHIETSAGIFEFMNAARRAVRSNGSVYIIYDIVNVDRLVQACERAGLFVFSAQEILHRRGCSTGRIVIRAVPVENSSNDGCVRTDDMTLHSPECDEPLYRPEIEEFFAALPPPVFEVGRTEYLGSPHKVQTASSQP
jgi:tRNA1(Val) A37 N6-methylase TrmN6